MAWKWVQNFTAEHTCSFSEGKQRIKRLALGQHVTLWKAPNSGWAVEANPPLIPRGSKPRRPHACQGPHPLTSLLNSSSVKPISCLVIW